MIMRCIKLFTFFQGYIFATENLYTEDNIYRKRNLDIVIEENEQGSKRKCIYKKGVGQTDSWFSQVSTNDQFLESLCNSLGFPMDDNDFDRLDDISSINSLPDVEQSTSFNITDDLGVESNTNYSLNVIPTPFAKMYSPLQSQIKISDIYKDKVAEVTEKLKITKDTNTCTPSYVLYKDLHVKSDVLPHSNSSKSITEYYRPNRIIFDIPKKNEDMDNCITGQKFDVSENLELKTNTTSQNKISAIASFGNSTILDQKDSIHFDQNLIDADINPFDNLLNLNLCKNTNKTTELKFQEIMSTNQMIITNQI